MSAHQIHFDPAVNDLIARERRAAAAEALRVAAWDLEATNDGCTCEACHTRSEVARNLRERADVVGGAR